MRLLKLNQFLLSISALCVVGAAMAAPEPYAPNRIPDVSNTKHNFSATATPTLPTGTTRTVKATSQSEVCIFCHTPHYAGVDGATDSLLPLWNHEATVAPYTPYNATVSNTLSGTPGVPGTSSKMCLSCHDGTVAVGSVLAVGNSVNITAGTPGAGVTGITPTTITMDGTNAGMIPDGSGATTGFTSNLGTDLTNDHPIAFDYNAALATADGEIVDPGDVSVTGIIGTRVGRKAAGLGATSSRFAAPLEAGKMECVTCHDPHIRGTGTDEDRNIKFLRLNRFQQAQPVDNTFTIASDIGCMSCHRKEGWAQSSHAHTSATAQYESTSANLRDFPANLQVWEASCMNCHDTHTVVGAKMLLREGNSDTNIPKVSGVSAQQETCFQCHGSAAKSVLQTPLPDLENLMSSGSHNVLATEIHTIQPAATLIDGADTVNQDGDHVETQVLVDNGSRHVECGDCHHPHRTTRSKVFDSTHIDVTTVVGQASPNWAGVDFTGQGTHVHEANTLHTNIASGSLRGTWGVEPSTWAGAAWNNDVATWQILQDDPSEAAATNIVTKEYQVCLKCHSGFANLGTATSQSMEFQAPVIDKGEPGGNHRSWHPVMDDTGRTAASANTFEAPFDVGVGSQTMYCSDCHGSDSAFDGEGPHGSVHAKVLKSEYTTTTGQAATESHLCFDCHKWDQYANPLTSGAGLENSGFSCATAANCWQNDGATGTNAGASNSIYTNNLHIAHASKDGGYACTQCHVSQPHGYQNKALLVTAGTEPAYEAANAQLQVDLWQSSGNWSRTLSGAGANDNCATSGCHTYP